MTTVQDGNEFESQVAALFAGADYTVERNPPIPGQQVDLVVSRLDDFGIRSRWIVECKYISSGSISNSVVQEFINYVKPLLERGYVGGIMVTNREFSLPAKNFAESYAFIVLKTYAELEDSLFSFSRSLLVAERRYRESEIFHEFIELYGSRSTNFDPGRRADLPRVNVFEDIMSTISGSTSVFSFLIGDFGSGKTTLIGRITYELSQRFVKDRTRPAPLVLRLNKFADAGTLQQFIEGQARLQLSPSVQAADVMALAGRGRIVVFLDGFDEIATDVSERKRLSYFEALLPLIQASRFCLISSRPSYFRSADEVLSLLGQVSKRRSLLEDSFATAPKRREDALVRQKYSDTLSRLQAHIFNQGNNTATGRSSIQDRYIAVYQLSNLEKPQVIAYLEKFSEALRKVHNRSVEEIYAVLSQVYDLKDLMTRPLLMRIVVEVLLAETLDLDDPQLSIGPAALYRMYINTHLETDWAKGPSRHFLEKQERLLFARAMAIAMVRTEAPSVSYQEIVDAIIRTFDSLRQERREMLIHQPDEVCTDVRVCAFLRMSDANRFEFIHRSFMEFLIADFIRERLDTGQVIEELKLQLSSAILYFLGSFVLIEPEFFASLTRQLSNAAADATQYRRNLFGALLYTGRKIHGLRASDCAASRLKLRDPTLVGPVLSNITLDEVSFDALQIVNGQLQSLTLDKCGEGEFRIEGCSGQVAVSNTRLNQFKLRSSPKLKVTLDFSRVEQLDSSQVGNMRVGSGAQVAHLEFADGELEIEGSTPFENGIPKLVCSNSRIRSSRGDGGAAFRRIRHSTWTSCEFDRFCLFLSDARNATFDACRGIIMIAGIAQADATPDTENFPKPWPHQRGKLFGTRPWQYEGGVLFVDKERIVTRVQKFLPNLLTELQQGELTPQRSFYWDKAFGADEGGTDTEDDKSY
jgi:restriction endonuclease/NACHT domain-containing protein